MDTLHVKFLHILKTALLGEQVEDPELTEQQWEALVVLAGQHIFSFNICINYN